MIGLMISTEPQARDRHWIILSQDGRYASVGGHTGPTPDEINEAENSLRSAGQSGWLALMEGTPYGRPTPRFMQVRSLADPTGSWDDAVASFLERRKPS